MNQENTHPPAGGSAKSEAASFIWETIKIVVIALVIILPIRYYLIQPFFVKGASMESTFLDGDYIFINELAYLIGDPQRGDVAVFKYPLDKREFFIKRIVGLPGETVEIKIGKVIIYNDANSKGIVLPESYLDANQQTIGNMRVELGEDEYFVLGDNRLRSSDSRRWGPLDRSLITGKAMVRLWPLSRVAKIRAIDYPTGN